MFREPSFLRGYVSFGMVFFYIYIYPGSRFENDHLLKTFLKGKHGVV